MNRDQVQSIPAPPVDKEAAERHARAELRQSVWEASQFMTIPEIQGYVYGVCREIESDTP